jgi:hypothetical protein
MAQSTYPVTGINKELMKYLLIFLGLAFFAGCTHVRPNYQFDCEAVGKDPKTGKLVSACE